MNSATAVNKLLISLAGILIFISLAFFIDLNGFSKYYPVLIILGMLVLLFSDDITKNIKSEWVSKHIVLTVSHVLIFLGLKVYLDLFVHQYWAIYLIIGVLLLNNSKLISKKIVKLF